MPSEVFAYQLLLDEPNRVTAALIVEAHLHGACIDVDVPRSLWTTGRRWPRRCRPCCMCCHRNLGSPQWADWWSCHWTKLLYDHYLSIFTHTPNSIPPTVLWWVIYPQIERSLLRMYKNLVRFRHGLPKAYRFPIPNPHNLAESPCFFVIVFVASSKGCNACHKYCYCSSHDP